MVVPATCNTDISMKGKHQMSTETSSGNADITNDTDQSPARNQQPIDLPPDFVQLIKETLIVINVSHLVRVFIVPLEIPVWWRGYHEVDGLVRQKR